jgi:hypothetical protein
LVALMLAVSAPTGVAENVSRLGREQPASPHTTAPTGNRTKILRMEPV